MIRGALILAAGFALGYVKALQEQAETAEFFSKAKDALDKIVEEVKTDEAPSAPETPEVVTPDDVENPREQGETS